MSCSLTAHKLTFKALTPAELEEKKKLQTLEGAIYREMDALLTENAALVEATSPESVEKFCRLRALEHS